MPKKKTHEEFIKEMSSLNPNIAVVGRYVNSTFKVDCKCLIDGYTWSATPHGLLSGYGCPKCGGTLKKTASEFANELYKVNQNIVLLNSYIDSKHKVICKCTLDSFEWNALPENLLKGHGCPKCSAKRSSEATLKSHDNFVHDVSNISPSIEILNTYQGVTSKITCFCSVCKNTWSTSASNLIAGKGCPECKRKKISAALSKSHEQFVNEVKGINSDIEILGQYVNSGVNILCKCKVDGNTWSATPPNILRGTGCPYCKCSHGEDAIANALNELNIKYIAQYRFENCKNERTLPFDFYLPELRTCIEYDGEQHFRPVNFGGCSNQTALQQFNRTVQNDAIKNQFCQENAIALFRIKYSDFKNIRSIIKNKFLSLTKRITISRPETAA